MTIFGAKKFWISSSESNTSQGDDQILKNSGYINIQLYSVNYKSSGNFWQNTFGGSDSIALSTNIKYTTSEDSIEATSIQDVRKVSINKSQNLGLQRNIAVKIPANADALEMSVKITAVKSDKLQAKFEMLNQPEFQAALQLAPTVVGQVVTITSLVKKLFTESDPHNELEATYAGIISTAKESHPIRNGKLTKGYLLLVSTDDGLSFDQMDESKFSVRGNSVFYGSTQVENTYALFDISFETLKGDDEKSTWFKKYAEALNILDNISITNDRKEIENIYQNSRQKWYDGNALLEADATYLYSEKARIKVAMLDAVNKKYQSLAGTTDMQPILRRTRLAPGILANIAGQDKLKDMKTILPNTVNYLEKNLSIDPNMSFKDDRLPMVMDNDQSAFSMLSSDAEKYKMDLKAEGKSLKLAV